MKNGIINGKRVIALSVSRLGEDGVADMLAECAILGLPAVICK